VDRRGVRSPGIPLALVSHGEDVKTRVCTPAGEVRQRFQLGDPSGRQKALQRLNDLELIELVQRGTYRVPDLFLRAWLRQTSQPLSG
jgi:hypothetical protein